MAKLEVSIINLTGTELDIDSTTRQALCEALSNLSVHHRKRGDLGAVRRVDSAFGTVWPGPLLEEDLREAQIRILMNLLLAEISVDDLSAGRATFSRARTLLNGNGGRAEAGVMEMLDVGLSSALRLQATEEVTFYLENLFEVRWAVHDALIQKRIISILWDIEERIGSTCNEDIIRVAGAIVERHANGSRVYDLLSEVLRKEPIERETRAELERRLEHLLTYVQVAGVSRATEIKLARLVAYYTWQFGDTLPTRLRQIWTFCVRRKGIVVEVEYPEGAFSGIASVLPFDFSGS